MNAKEVQGRSLLYIAVEPDNFSRFIPLPVIVLLHGFGASMTDLVSLSMSFKPEGYVFIFPNAPMPIQLGPGVSGYAWTPPGDSGADAEDAEERAEEALDTLFEEVIERYGAEPGNILLGGFSQGGMMTYRCGLSRPDMFAGLVILSSRVPSPDTIRDRLPEDRSQPIFISHGTSDMMIPIAGGSESREFLEAEGYTFEYHEYPMGHEISQEVLDDLVAWTNNVLPPGGPD